VAVPFFLRGFYGARVGFDSPGEDFKELKTPTCAKMRPVTPTGPNVVCISISKPLP
jgi:hypothetical protein